jgi:hypothetical protein
LELFYEWHSVPTHAPVSNYNAWNRKAKKMYNTLLQKYSYEFPEIFV